MTEFKWFKNVHTGKTGKYPAHYASWPSLVEIDPVNTSCVPCMSGSTKTETVDEAKEESYADGGFILADEVETTWYADEYSIPLYDTETKED